MTVNYSDIQAARQRIQTVVSNTPIVSSQRLNAWLSEHLPANQRHTILFKAECLQKTGAFKLRGASNFVSTLIEQKRKPNQIVANSSGNHAQAVAYTAANNGIPASIFAAQNISPIKAAATRSYGAELHLFKTRPEADKAVQQASENQGTVWIPPFNHPYIIAGQGTAVDEAFDDIENIDAVFAPCGGGGLVSGSLITARARSSITQVFGVEPLAANDAAESLRVGKIQSLTGPAKTLADGAATPSVGEFTFPWLQQLDGFYEVDENAICYWTQWLHHLLKLHIEPTCCMTMQAVAQYLAKQASAQTVLVVLSGGNISVSSMQTVYDTDHLLTEPHIEIFKQ